MNAPEQPREQRSLFGEILDWMLAPLLLLWPMSVVLTWLVAQGIANRPFDRELGEMARVLSKEVVVRDAQGAPPTIPFWRGEAPGRTFELSAEVARLREEMAESPFGMIESFVKGLFRGARWKHIARRLEMEHQRLKALQ